MRKGGFKFGGWVAPFADVDPVFGAEIGKLFGEPFDLLLGRRTYDIFAAHWPYAEGGPYDDIARTFNRITKYVATRKGADLTWKGSVALRDAAKDVACISLLAADLVDEIRTFTFPVVLGKGKRLFDERSQPRAFTVAHSAVSPSGLIAATYMRDGEVKTATVGGAQEPSAAELARREKLQTDPPG